jgi:GntR family transcriptional regulator
MSPCGSDFLREGQIARLPRRSIWTYCTYKTDNATIAMSTLIDRTSPEPFYVQLTRLLEAEMDAGKYAVGDRLPGESELCRNYDLARSTVRETLRSLQERGRIRMVPRRGAYVVDPNSSGWFLQVPDGFFEAEVGHNRRNVLTRVLEAGYEKVPDIAASALDLEPPGLGYRLKRLRFLDGKPAMLSTNFLTPAAAAVVDGTDVLNGRASLNQTLRGGGFGVFGARRSVEALPATEELSRTLGVAVGAPLLLVTSVSWGRDERPFDYYTSWVRTDVVKITIEATAAGR